MGTEETLKKESAPPRKVRVINETPDSNPQLAEKLSLLSDALNMDLELVEQEAWIGHYNGDILPHDQRNDAAVVIEHHSDETYHYQLGQVLACAENYDARILIWIADNIREEHRSALDWLNRWTPKDIQVFGVEQRTSENGDSEAKVEFVPVVFPESWTRSDGTKPKPVKLQNVVLREFFQPLVDRLRIADFTGRQNASASRYQPFPSGVSGISYIVSLELNGNAWVYIPGGTPSLNALRQDVSEENVRNKLEISDGTGFNWRAPGPGSLGVYRKATLHDSDEELEDIRKWMFHYLIKFQEVFNPRMEKIISELENSDE